MNFDDIEKKFAKYRKKRLTRSQAIKIYCKEFCSSGDLKSWRECSFTACPLWRFRRGRESLAKEKFCKKDTQKPTFLAKKDDFEKKGEKKW